MFGEFREMVDFLTHAPLYIIGAFLTTFVSVKIAQSETLYRWMEGKLDLWRAKRLHKVRRELMLDIVDFLQGRKEEELAPSEQKIYYQMLESYYATVERMYGSKRHTKENV